MKEESEEILRPPGGCLWCLAGVAALFVLWALLFPSIAWTGSAWLSIHVRVTDAATKLPIANATVTLLPEPRSRIDERISSPTILTTRTDADGNATLHHMFGAGGGNHNTTIVVRSSRVRCEAVGYVPSEVRVAESERLRFRNFPFFGSRNHSTKVSVTLSRQ